jgi:hypothetical protein
MTVVYVGFKETIKLELSKVCSNEFDEDKRV